MSRGSALTGFLLGAGVGAVFGILYAPRPGVETRAMVSESVEDMWGQGQAAYDRGVQRVQEVYAEAADRVDEVASNVGPYVSSKNDELREKIDEARERIAAEVNRNAAAAHDAISERIPVAAERVDAAVTDAETVVHEAAEKIAPKKGVEADTAAE